MKFRFIRAAAAVCAAATFVGCASTYNSRTRAAHRAFHRGDYDRALAIVEKAQPAQRDRLLYLMDKGMILHGAGRYEESNRVLAEAEDLADAFTAKSISREAAAALWSEEATQYAGERFEKVLIPVIRMLNYIMLDQWDEAMVEVRRVEYVVEKTYGAGEKPDNAFATYLSAVVWEAMGKINDAFIDYRRTGRIEQGLPYYGHDLKYTSRRLALPVEFPAKGSGAWRSSRGYRQAGGELIVIVESGRAPRFVSETVRTSQASVQMPTAVAWPLSVRNATVYVDGEEVGQTHVFYSVADDIFEALKDRRKRSFVRKAIRMAVQTGIYVASVKLMDVDKTEAKLAGLALMFLGMSMAASEKADERSWRTLPAEFGIGRFYVAPGVHRIRIEPEGEGEPIERAVEVGQGKPKAILAHLTSRRTPARRLAARQPERVTRAKAKARRIDKRLDANPGSGPAMVDLAYAKMEGGDYKVDRLLIDGWEHGGDRRRAMMGLCVANMVRGDFKAARSWALKGRKLGGHDAGRFADYADIAETLTSGAAASPSSDERPLLDREGLMHAFDWFVMGLLDERAGQYADASEKFAKAYELGLVGAPVEKRVMDSFGKTDSSFKRSAKGIGIMEAFADSLVP